MKLICALLFVGSLFGQGTTPTTGTWAHIAPNGGPVSSYGYGKTYYDSSRKLYCMRGGYHADLQVVYEDEQSIMCWSYAENRWLLMQRGAETHTAHNGEHGHTDQLIDYIPTLDAIVYQTDGSESLTVDQQVRSWWMTDLGGLTTRNIQMRDGQWMYGATEAEGVWCPNISRLLHWDNGSGQFFFYDPSTNVETAKTTTGATFSGIANAGIEYNATDGLVYFFGGANTADVYSVDVTTSPLTIRKFTSTACTGGTCSGNKPPVRLAPGWAYSTTDSIFLMAGGVTPSFGSTAINDTWTFDPLANSGNGQWTLLSPGASYTIDNNRVVFGNLKYDPDDNVFIIFTVPGTQNWAEGSWNLYAVETYVFPLSAATGNYGRTTAPRNPTAGSLNVIDPTTTDSSSCSTTGSKCQSWARGPDIAVSGSTVYAAHIETGAQFDITACGANQHVYVQSTPNNSTWTGLPTGGAGSQFVKREARCLALDSDKATMGATSNVHLGVVSGTLWEIHDKTTAHTGGTSQPNLAFVNSWSGSAWSGGATGCFSGTCLTGSSGFQQLPYGIVGVGSVPHVAIVETDNRKYIRESYLVVAKYSAGSWSQVGTRLNITGASGACTTAGGVICSRVDFATIATDGTNPAACWSEEANTNSRYGNLSTTPQIQCSQWDGVSAWVRFGAASLNQSVTSYAYEPTMTYMGGSFYIAYTERTLAGNSKLFLCRWTGSACSLIGGGTLNTNTSTGWAAHPYLANDGTNVYVAWEEQAALGSHSLGYVKKWNGSSVSTVGAAIAADTTNGSIEGISLAMAGSTPTVAFAEMTFGTLRQSYVRQWDGVTWNATLGQALATKFLISQ